MKVTKITSLPLQDEEGKVYFFVKVDTDKGIHGLGEVGIARQGNAISKAIEHLSELVIGSDPWKKIRSPISHLFPFYFGHYRMSSLRANLVGGCLPSLCRG